MTAPDYVAQAAELLRAHQKVQVRRVGARGSTILNGRVCDCGREVPWGAWEQGLAAHQAEVLAAAGLIPTHTEWGVRTSKWHVSPVLGGEQAARDFTRGPSSAPVVSRAVTDWKDASDD